MSEFLLSIGGFSVQKLEFLEVARGLWIVDGLLTDPHELSGRVEVVLGSRVLSGTIDPEASGDWLSARRARVVAGAGGWDKPVSPEAYCNDLGVPALTVAQDAARAAGETLGTFEPGSARLGPQFVRRGAPEWVASDALEACAGGVPWWLDDMGVTHVRQHPTQPPDGECRTLTFDTGQRLVGLGIDDPSAVRVGTILTDRLSSPQVVRMVRLYASPEELRAEAWVGGEDSAPARLARGLLAVAHKAQAGKLLGRYRYRLRAMAGDRYMLDPVKRSLGLPSIGPVAARPGAAGMWASCPKGTELVVSFLDDGDPSQPYVENFAPKGDACFLPDHLGICDPDGTAPAAARVGDTVDVFWPDAVPIEGLIDGTAHFVGTMTVLQSGVGQIAGPGSRIVSIG